MQSPHYLLVLHYHNNSRTFRNGLSSNKSSLISSSLNMNCQSCRSPSSENQTLVRCATKLTFWPPRNPRPTAFYILIEQTEYLGALQFTNYWSATSPNGLRKVHEIVGPHGEMSAARLYAWGVPCQTPLPPPSPSLSLYGQVRDEKLTLRHFRLNTFFNFQVWG